MVSVYLDAASLVSMQVKGIFPTPTDIMVQITVKATRASAQSITTGRVLSRR